MSMYMGCDKVSITLRNNEIYRSKEEVLEEIEGNKKAIEGKKLALFGMICGNISDVFACNDAEGDDEGGETNIEKAISAFTDLIDGDDGIIDLVERNVDLGYIVEHWDDRWSEADGYGMESMKG